MEGWDDGASQCPAADAAASPTAALATRAAGHGAVDGVVAARARRGGRFARPRILVVGCGDVGRRLVALIGDRFRVFATVRSADGVAAMRATGVTPIVADLDDHETLGRLGGIASTVVHLAPPPATGPTDPRTRALLRALHGVRRFVYVSTSGVYGDCQDAAIDETRKVNPQSDRARRRVDAERRLRKWAVDRGVTLSILRVPGIYAADRLPVARLEAGTPALRESDDVHTNHVHADDLARIVVTTIFRGAPQRVYHAVDDSDLKMGDWFDRVADTHGLPRPERLARADIEARVSPALLSFMRESRRLSNRRLREELGVRLRFPTVRDGLVDAISRA